MQAKRAEATRELRRIEDAITDAHAARAELQQQPDTAEAAVVTEAKAAADRAAAVALTDAVAQLAAKKRKREE